MLTHWLIRIFVKNHSNTANPRVRENYGRFAGWVGIVTNLLLFAGKFTVGTLSGSIAIVADAVNNLSDSGSSLVTLAGFKLSGKPADREHPYGHERSEYVAGLIVSFLILSIGVQLVMESFDKIIHPKPADFSPVAWIVLALAIVIKLWQHFFYRRIARTIDSITLMATASDSRNDVIATIAVLLSAILSRLTGFNLDGFMGMAVALFIMISGIKLIMETVSPLLGTMPKPELVAMIRDKILSYDKVLDIHDLTVHSYGATRIYASVHCEMSADEDILLSHDVIDTIEKDFQRDLDIQLVIHLDPVQINDERTNALKAEVSQLIAGISPHISMHDFRVVWGVRHTNLIFDILVPFEWGEPDESVVQQIQASIAALNPTYHAVIVVDRDYTSEYRKSAQGI